MKKRIGILTIATGKYGIFVNQLYRSCEQFFLPEFEKDYYIFSDTISTNTERIKVIPQRKLGWPFDTMYRFKFFNSVRGLLSSYDFLYFFNANMQCVSVINSEILPNEDKTMVGVIHPGYYLSDVNLFPYERNVKSEFYIPYETGTNYYQGCFFGGYSVDFLNMSELLENKIETDLSNGITPIWHYESALNWYYLKN